MGYDIDSLESADNPLVLFRGIVGSRAYGTQNANSDTDVRGIFVVPSAEYARLAQPTFDEIMTFADEKRGIIEGGKSRLPPDCDRSAVDALIAAVMKEAGVA